MKNWTLETILRQLRTKIEEAFEEDMLDPSTLVRSYRLGDVLDKLIEADVHQRITGTPGQSRVVYPDLAIDVDVEDLT